MRKLVLLLLVAALLGATIATVDAGAAGVRARAMKLRLKPFPTCKRLVRYARHYAPRELRYGAGAVVAPGPGPPFAVTPTGDAQGGRGTAAPEAAPTPAAGDSSQTNVQEAGVDEPDIVKSDGTRIFAIAGGRLNAVDARAATPKLLGSLELPSYGGEMLLRGDRALVFSYAGSPVEILPGPRPGGGPQPARGAQVAPGPAQPDIAYYRPATLITEVDVSDPANMRIVRTETIDGTYVSARMNGATARIVLTTPPAFLDYGQPTALRARARGWLPRARLENRITGRTRTRQITPCNHVRRPRVFSGLDVLTVLTVDMRKGLPAVDTDSLMTDGQTVYASNDGLYVATQRFVPPPAVSDQPPPPLTTAIHRFDISEPGRTSYSASGEAPGFVLGQFALSEFKGVLRVASTESPVWWPGAPTQESQSYVTTLKESGGALLPLGRVGGLGKGERITGVRFLDDAGYVVTFRQTDPLYTIDLSEPNAPRVAGELKLLGFSAYLHPVGDGLLLGVGQDATEQGRQLGTQLSLFDVSDLAHPARLSQRRVGSSSSSEVEYDHHAFLYWAPEKLAVLPVSIFDGTGDPFNGAIGFRVGRSRIDEVGRVEHTDAAASYSPGIRRSVVIGDRLFTISDLGAKSSNLSTLADEAWVPFPAPPEPQPQPEPAGQPQSSPPSSGSGSSPGSPGSG
jgi:Beta propeller domain